MKNVRKRHGMCIGVCSIHNERDTDVTEEVDGSAEGGANRHLFEGDRIWRL